MKRPLDRTVFAGFLIVLVVFCGLLAGGAQAQEDAVSDDPAGGEAELETVDRIVAVVDEDPILASAIDRAIGLGLVSRNEGESDDDFRRRTLDLMVAERLRAHEVDRFGFTEISLAEVEQAVAALASRFPSRRAFDDRIEEFGLTMNDVRQLVARQVMVLTYVDERLGPRVFVSLDDVREYYESVLTPEMKKRGQAIPDLSEVREEIRGVLREQRLNEEIERWTEELRLEADIDDYFDRPTDETADTVVGVRRASD